MLQNKNLLKLHLTVLIWGFTAILGALISKSALVLVWYRMIFASVSLLVYIVFRRQTLKIPGPEILRLLANGTLVALHWFLFYYCIKISSISVALVCLSSITLFTSILEPLINKRKFLALDMITGLVIVTGIILIFKFESRYVFGTCIGLGAALGASFFTIFNSRFAKRTDPVLISFYEMCGGLICLSSYMLLSGSLNRASIDLSTTDLIYLLILSTVCTAMAYVMAVSVMKTLSPITVVLTTSLEPVYGIVLAFLFFGKKEQMTGGFYVGALIILGAVLSYPLIKKRLLLPEAFSEDMETEKKFPA